MEKWQGWLGELLDDENSRSQIEYLIQQKLDSDANHRAEALSKFKEIYDRIGKKEFLALYKEQTGEDLPDELLEFLRSG